MIVQVTRGDFVESVHHVAACAVDARGRVLDRSEKIDVPVYLRSAAKPFIAAAVIEAGAGEAFGFEPREIAVMAASHTGEPFHVDAVASILRKIGLDERALQCGIHLPYDQAAAHALIRQGREPTALFNNCSGKHAGILALCKMIGAPIETYLELQHPAQQRILALCARLHGDDPQRWPVAVDGCGIPVYATSLRRAGQAFARMAALEEMNDRDAEAVCAVRDAMIAFPQYVSGTGQLDTLLMQAGGGTIACKSGAEGVHGVAALSAGWGYASKVLDGAGRARGPSTIAALERLGALSAEKATELIGLGQPIVYNRAGRAVGDVRAISS